MEVQLKMNYLLFLQNLRDTTGGIFDNFMLQITSLAESQITFLALALIYWCIDKRAGQFMAFNVTFACTLNQFLKPVCKVERPWVVDERIHPVEAAIPAAAGYSFPSGHTARGIAVWGAAGTGFWKKREYRGIGGVCWALVVLVMFSRNYLGVHTFWDVFASFVIGVLFLVLTDWILRWAEAGKNRDVLVCIAGCILCFLPMLKIGCMTNSGAGIGFLLGWLIERRFIQFETKGSIAEKGIRFAVGAFVVLGILQVLKPILALFMNAKYASFFTVCVLMFFITAVYPYLFVSIKQGKKVIAGFFSIAVAVMIALAAWKVAVIIPEHESDVTEQSQTQETEVEETQTEALEEAEVTATDTLIIGHRGYNSEFPENTLASFAGAIDIGVDYVETDVQMTKDGRIVLFHDDNLIRLAGIDGKIADYTYEELQQIDVGSWFDATYAGERIPSLEEFLELVQPSGCMIYLELKDIGMVEGFEQAVLNITEQYGMTDRCVFASFQYQYLQHLKQMNENVAILYNTNSAKTTLSEEFPAEYYGLNADTVTVDTVTSIHQSGARAFSWTADTPTQIQNLIAMGIDGIVTNRPGLAKIVTRREYSYLAENFESAITMPGLYENNLPEMCQDMVVQGFTQAENYLVISAYSSSGTYNSILYITDLNGNLIKTVDLCFKSHTGGIAYDELHDLLWVAGVDGSVYGLSWSMILTDQYMGECQVSFDAGLVNHNGAKVASFVALDRGELYVGSYVDGNKGKMNCYDISDVSTPRLLHTAAIPERIQGVTFQTDTVNGTRYMFMTQGYQMEDAYLMKFAWDDQITNYEEPLEKHMLPEGAEQLLMTGKGLYILFESSARPYRATARIPNDQIYIIRTSNK